MKRILHVLMSDTFSGAENVVCQIIEMFKDEDVEMFYAGIEGPVIRQALAERAIKFVPMRSRSIKEVRKAILQINPTLIHAHDMKASFFVAITCGSIPYISHIHNNSFDSRGINKKTILYYFAARKAKYIIWVSKSAFKGYYFNKHFKQKSSVLYNVLNRSELIQKMQQDRNEYFFDMVFVGRLTYPKNPQRLISIFDLIHKKNPNIKLAIVGKGSLENELHEQIKKLKLERSVTFMGFQSNPYKIMKDAKVMIMTSLWEGTPMCALEAMGLGVPIVSTPTDGMCELIINGKTGFLEDNDIDIAEKCLYVIENSEVYKKMHEATLQRADELLEIIPYKKKLMEIYSAYL